MGIDGGKIIAENLGLLVNLSSLELYLAINDLGEEGGFTLKENLMKLTGLTVLKLNLSFNEMGEEVASEFVNGCFLTLKRL